MRRRKRGRPPPPPPSCGGGSWPRQRCRATAGESVGDEPVEGRLVVGAGLGFGGRFAEDRYGGSHANADGSLLRFHGVAREAGASRVSHVWPYSRRESAGVNPLTGRHEDWPSGFRTLTPRESTREPNGTLWSRAGLDPDGDQIWFRTGKETIGRMPSERAAAVAWSTPSSSGPHRTVSSSPASTASRCWCPRPARRVERTPAVAKMGATCRPPARRSLRSARTSSGSMPGSPAGVSSARPQASGPSPGARAGSTRSSHRARSASHPKATARAESRGVTGHRARSTRRARDRRSRSSTTPRTARVTAGRPAGGGPWSPPPDAR